MEKYMVFEIATEIGADDIEIANNLTKEDAQKLVDEKPKHRVMIPQHINGN